jgi:peptidoglycan/LPS O-acetylase OafA/YrhL
LTFLAAAIFYGFAIKVGHSFNHESASNLSIENVVLNVLIMQAWFDVPSLNGPAWSVSAEIGAYLIFPVFLWSFTRKVFANKFRVALILILSIIWNQVSLYHDIFLNRSMNRVFSEFLSGLCLFFLCRGVNFQNHYVLMARSILNASILATLILVNNEFILSTLMPVLLLLLVAANSIANIPGKGMGRGFLLKLGLWSYSLYLSHRLLQNIMSGLGLPIYSSELLINWFQFGLLIFLPIAIAAAITHLIEIPMRKFILDKFS